MLTFKIYDGEEGIFKNPDDAIEYMIKTNFKRSVHLYSINSKEAYAKTEEIYKFIREYNKGKPLNNQILPTTPFGYRGILGCLGVQVYEITFETYSKNHEFIVIFGSYREDVLDTTVEKPDIRPGLKALSSLALISKMIRK